MAPELTDQALARTAAAIHGCFKASSLLLAPATDTVIIAVLAGRPRVRRSIPAAIVTVMEAGSSIRPVSTGAPVPAETAVQRTTTTLRTA